MTMQSLAMRARRALAMPPGFDVRQRALFVFQHSGTGRFVRVGLRPLLAATREAERMLAKRAFERAAHTWQTKYGEPFPETAFIIDRAECVLAHEIDHEGASTLSANESAWVRQMAGPTVMTLDIFWLLLEGLGWRPGHPVREDDPGWLAVWAEEECTPGVIGSVRAFQAMPRAAHWVPPAVEAAYSGFPQQGRRSGASVHALG